jgi:transposase InsO family protein
MKRGGKGSLGERMRRIVVVRLHGRRFATRCAAMDEVIDRMSYYNYRRLHSTLDYISPVQFERRWLADQEKRAA